MGYSAKILLDSLNASTGHRLTTFEVSYPRIVHSELMTHRVNSRNAASSRAIPAKKIRDLVITDPFYPIWWGKNQSGMQAKEELVGDDLEAAKAWWKEAIFWNVNHHEKGEKLGIHKQILNRILEPYQYITVIVSATTYSNFFALRCDPDAQPELQKIAVMMYEEYRQNKPKILCHGEWHLPLILDVDRQEEPDIGKLCKISSARCARISYLTHDNKRDHSGDLELYDKLVKRNPKHASPLEHVARAMPCIDSYTDTGNFKGWIQLRKTIPNENIAKYP